MFRNSLLEMEEGRPKPRGRERPSPKNIAVGLQLKKEFYSENIHSLDSLINLTK